MLAALTDPPYWIRTVAAASAPAIDARSVRSAPHTACASAGVAVRPVPIAQIGSYATTIDATAAWLDPGQPGPELAEHL